MKKLNKKTIAILGTWTIAASSLAFGGMTFANMSWFAFDKQDLTSKTYEEFTQQVAWTKLEGKISEEKFTKMQEKAKQRQEKQEQMKQIIENKDFEAWKTQIGERKWPQNEELLEKIDTQEKFEKFLQIQQIMQTAREETKAIREELGLQDKWKFQKRHWKKFWKRNWNFVKWMWLEKNGQEQVSQDK